MSSMMANDVPCVKPPASLSCLTKGVKISHTGLIWPISPILLVFWKTFMGVGEPDYYLTHITYLTFFCFNHSCVKSANKSKISPAGLIWQLLVIVWQLQGEDPVLL